MNNHPTNKGLIRRVLLTFIPGIVGIGALFFIPGELLITGRHGCTSVSLVSSRQSQVFTCF